MSKAEFNRKSRHLHELLDRLTTQMSYETGFVQRASKMSGAIFAKTFVLGCLDNPQASLNDLVQYSQRLGVSISEAGLQQRIQQPGVDLLRDLMQDSIAMCRQKSGLPQSVLRHFSQVNILDSTEIKLPDNLRSSFKGKQGAAVKVQLSFDYLSGTFNALELTAASQPDQKCQLHVQQASRGSLTLFDLGYFDQKVLKTLAERSAYFVSRLQTQTALYREAQDEQAIDLLTWLRQGRHRQREAKVYVGRTARLPVRLLAQKLPLAVVEERRRKAKAQARRWGNTCSQRQLDLLAWALFITNVPAEYLTLEQVVLVYGIRWQIELLFKVCKSQAELDHVRSWSAARVQCQLYARLLGVIIFQWLVSPYRFTQRGELSLSKAFGVMQRYSLALLEGLTGRKRGLSSVLEAMALDFLRFAQKNSRKKSPSSYQRLLDIEP